MEEWRWQQNDSVNLKMDQQRWSTQRPKNNHDKKSILNQTSGSYGIIPKANIRNIRTPEERREGLVKIKYITK